MSLPGSADLDTLVQWTRALDAGPQGPDAVGTERGMEMSFITFNTVLSCDVEMPVALLRVLNESGDIRALPQIPYMA